MTSTITQAQSPKYDTSFRLLDFNIFDEKREQEEEDDGGAENEEESSHRRNNEDADDNNGQKKYKKDDVVDESIKNMKIAPKVPIPTPTYSTRASKK